MRTEKFVLVSLNWSPRTRSTIGALQIGNFFLINAKKSAKTILWQVANLAASNQNQFPHPIQLILLYRGSSSNAVFRDCRKKNVLEGKTVLEEDFLSTIYYKNGTAESRRKKPC